MRKIIFKIFKFRVFKLNKYVTIYTGLEGYTEPNDYHDGKPNRVELGIVYDNNYPRLLAFKFLILDIELRLEKYDEDDSPRF